PTFQSYNSRDPLGSYCSDAFFGLMDSTEGAFGDGSGDRMDLGIGRIPVRDAGQATAMVRKIQEYLDPSNRGPWRNEFVFVADDQDYNIHLNDCAELVRHTETQHPQGLVRKIYADAYEQESRPGGARYPAVND
ncbi:MAG: C25 family cysteine peptidase, partial [Bacteroidota bacterium]